MSLLHERIQAALGPHVDSHQRLTESRYLLAARRFSEAWQKRGLPAKAARERLAAELDHWERRAVGARMIPAAVKAVREVLASLLGSSQ